jgi:aminoglycoside phosphotransferase (APT) family kinase protein
VGLDPKPRAEVDIDASLVRRLLCEQHPDIADLALTEIGEGWDNTLFRLGSDLAVRLPRRAVSAVLIEHEQRWLPILSSRLPLSIPAPVRIGAPGCGYPWSWSVVPWFAGECALKKPPLDLVSAATDLGAFLRSLHQPAPDDVPVNPWRASLGSRTSLMTERLQRVGGIVDRTAIVALWDRVLSVPSWSGPPLWVHGDLHPGNVVVSGRRLSAVIDFGDLTSGDPATDLSVAWMLFPPALRPSFRESARNPFNPIDDHTWMRARGWALTLGLAYLAYSHDDEEMGVLGKATINAALEGA